MINYEITLNGSHANDEHGCEYFDLSLLAQEILSNDKYPYRISFTHTTYSIDIHCTVPCIAGHSSILEY